MSYLSGPKREYLHFCREKCENEIPDRETDRKTYFMGLIVEMGRILKERKKKDT